MLTILDLPPAPPGKTGWPWTEGCPPSLGGVPIAIVTPSFNQGRFIEETIRSVLLQGVENVRYIIRDGGSTDETRAILEKYRPFCAEVVIAPDDGQSAVINEVLSSAQEPIVGWLNSDDVLFPGALAACTAAWAQKPFSTLIGQSEYRNEDGIGRFWQVEEPPTTREGLFGYSQGVFVAQPSVFFTPEAFRAVGALDLSLRYTMDLDLWFRLFERGGVTFVPLKLSWMRAHDAAKTSKAGLKLLDEVEAVFDRYDAAWRSKHPAEVRAMREKRHGPSLYRRARAFLGRHLKA